MRFSKEKFKAWFESLDESEKKQVLYKKTCFYLSKREYSRFELKQKLIKKYGTEFENIIQHNLDFFEEKGWQSDERFTRSFVRSKIRKGQGLNRIKMELQQKKVDIDPSELDIELPNFQKLAEEEVVKKYKRDLKKWNESSYEDKNKIKQKIYNFLRYRGLPLINIESFIDKIEELG